MRVIPDDWLARQIARARCQPKAMSPPCRAGWPRSAPTPMPPIARAGRATARIGRAITRAVEDRLSDALHERLTQRFIDRRTSVLMKHLRDDEFAALALDEAGGVSIGGEAIGRLDGFRFVPDPGRGAMARFMAAPCAPPRCKGLESESPPRSAALARSRRRRHHPQRTWQAVVGRRHRRPADRRRLAAGARHRAAGRRACEDATRLQARLRDLD